MQPIFRWIAGLVMMLALPLLAHAGQTPASRPPGSEPQQTQQTPPPPPPPPPPAQTPPPQDPTYKETVVVSASKIEQQLVDAPATITVIGPRALGVAPSNNYADLLRSVPGVNITQISARDVNVTSRGATSSLATSQLAVVDGRSIYQDFFGFTMWDFMPSNLDEIKRIEVIRGPASAVWGANALNGVINVITKSPREMEGTSATFGIGAFGREVADNGASAGTVYYARGTHARAINDRLSFKLSIGTYSSGPLARPTGLIPNGGTTPYPPYANTGTTQPKVDVRFDYDLPDGERKLQFSGGIAGTDGVMHTGIGPFNIESGAKMGYWKVNFLRRAFKLQVFMNVLNGQATNLVSVDPQGRPIDLDFDTKTFDVEFGDTRLISGKHVLTLGGNLRANRFDLTIAPAENSRTEGGLYIQDEFMAHDKFRIVAGARVDKFSSIEDPVFSPRVALVMKPRTDQSIRVSFNRAFRAPSMINNNLETTVATALPLGAVNPAFAPLGTYLVPTDAVGNPDLTEERIDTFEIAYTATIRDRASVSAAWYYNSFADQIFFTNVIGGVPQVWGPATPPPGWPLSPAVWGLVYQNGIIFPRRYTYENLGEVKSQGLELGLDGAVNDTISAFANYSFQADPDPSFPGLTKEQALREINIPAKHLVNVGVSYVSDRAFGTLSVSRSSEAFWQDVLDSRFSGTTKPYTSVNLTIGLKFQDGRYQASFKATNLTNQEIMQHIFSDVVRRQVVAEFRIKLPK